MLSIFALCKLKLIHCTGASPRKFLWEYSVKSWASYPGKYSDRSDGATNTK